LRLEALAKRSRREEESVWIHTSTTNDTELRRNRRRGEGFGRRRTVCGVAPPRRAPGTPSSSRLASGAAALRTHFYPDIGIGSKDALPLSPEETLAEGLPVVL